MIIGAAIALAVLKTRKKLTKKKITAKPDFKNITYKIDHNCTGCSADCMLRENVKPLVGKKKELCRQIEVNRKL